MAHLDHPNIVRYHNAWLEKATEQRTHRKNSNKWYIPFHFRTHFARKAETSTESEDVSRTVSSTASSDSRIVEKPVQATSGSSDTISTDLQPNAVLERAVLSKPLPVMAPIIGSGYKAPLASAICIGGSDSSGAGNSNNDEVVQDDSLQFSLDMLGTDDDKESLRLRRVTPDIAFEPYPAAPAVVTTPPLLNKKKEHTHHAKFSSEWDTCILYIQMHLYEATLDTWLKTPARRVNKLENADIFRQVVEAIKYVHSLGIIHRLVTFCKIALIYAGI